MAALEEELAEFTDEERWELTNAAFNCVDGGPIDRQNACDGIIRWLTETPGQAQRLLAWKRFFQHVERDAGKRVIK